MRAGAWALIGAMAVATSAAAANAPLIGPPPAWDRPAPAAPPEKDDLSGLPFVILSDDIQLSFDADGWTEYHDVTG